MNVRERSKQALLERLLEQGMVMVTVDARRHGVDVPAALSGDAQLRLNLSYRFNLPMTVDAAGIHATLTFAGKPHACRLPWNAIYVVFAHATSEPFVFPADAPPDLVAASARAPRDEGPDLSIVVDASDENRSEPASDRSRRAHLRVVK